MPLSAVAIRNYRSVRNLWLPVEQLSVFVGANGVGKTNLYKALALLRRAADGTITRAIAEEGGLDSVLWAGPRSDRKPMRLVLKARFDELEYAVEMGLPHSYEIEIGLPQPAEAAFPLEPLVKAERLVARDGRREIVMMERKGPLVTLRNDDGKRESHQAAVLSSETALASFRDGARYPELEAVRREMLEWRLYHDFRTDAGSPIRRPCHAITTPTLSPDGHDLAAVLATLSVIREDTAELDAAIDDAFPGGRLEAGDEGSWCRVSLTFPDMPRSFAVHELSDGTLKYLCLLGALMGYRLPPLIALNEPETSLHPSLLAPLARRLASAAGHTRIWIVTHSEDLAGHLQQETGKRARRVVKPAGATGIEGLKLSGEYADEDE
ncbi:AAA family ATPase [Bradyrhizobium sp.]|jgi:predicted ATPase|uniref:AAA family ATPase n=1 Tax=Bradyrhizobium sp. TaxID=376 RepID=UPI002C252B01|nr:AAA family ATPase [Bradyrhizobium sp.]HWX61106.1 AAA family ATPase [Bradyrhizobium sp.]